VVTPFFSIFSAALPRLPAIWALPLPFCGPLLLAASLLAGREPISVTMALCVCNHAHAHSLERAAASSSWCAALVSERRIRLRLSCTLRIALALSLAGATLLVSRLALPPPLQARVALDRNAWHLVAIFLPGCRRTSCSAAPRRFSFLPRHAFQELDSAAGTIALFAAALVTLLVWSSIGASGESVMGSSSSAVYGSFAIGLTTLVPLFTRYAMPRRLWALRRRVVCRRPLRCNRAG